MDDGLVGRLTGLRTRLDARLPRVPGAARAFGVQESEGKLRGSLGELLPSVSPSRCDRSHFVLCRGSADGSARLFYPVKVESNNGEQVAWADG